MSDVQHSYMCLIVVIIEYSWMASVVSQSEYLTPYI